MFSFESDELEEVANRCILIEDGVHANEPTGLLI